MLIKTRAIVISALRYQEKSLVVKCFTREAGLKSYFIRDAFSNKKSAQKIAYFQPLNLLEIEATHKNKGNLEYLKEIRLASPYLTINTNVVKSSLAVFLSEVLHHCIREEEKNDSLYTFLETALLWLDTHDEVADFHLVLLMEITKFLGFYPDNGNTSCEFFEMTDGVFTQFQSLTCLSAGETQLLRRLMALRLDTGLRNFSVGERQSLLKIMMDYYAFHLDGFRRPKSAEVLREVLG